MPNLTGCLSHGIDELDLDTNSSHNVNLRRTESEDVSSSSKTSSGEKYFEDPDDGEINSSRTNNTNTDSVITNETEIVVISTTNCDNSCEESAAGTISSRTVPTKASLLDPAFLCCFLNNSCVSLLVFTT